MTFSILYTPEEKDSYTEYAVDWNWNVKGEWARSYKEGLGGRWITIRGLDEDAYEALLERFGLEDYGNELPLERIIKLSPHELGRIRRQKEKEHGLEYKEIASDTLGEHVRIA